MKKVLSLIVRYFLILLAGLGNLTLFYRVFTPITFYLSSFTLSLFGEVVNFYAIGIILFNQTSIELIEACIAGSAYYLLFILVISMPNLKLLKRVSILLFSFALLLVVNVIRIVLMGLISETPYFESVHMLFWYFVSILFVVGIWFLTVKVFSIKEIPVYSDLKYLIEQTKHSKRKSKYNNSCNKHTKRN